MPSIPDFLWPKFESKQDTVLSYWVSLYIQRGVQWYPPGTPGGKNIHHDKYYFLLKLAIWRTVMKILVWQLNHCASLQGIYLKTCDYFPIRIICHQVSTLMNRFKLNLLFLYLQPFFVRWKILWMCIVRRCDSWYWKNKAPCSYTSQCTWNSSYWNASIGYVRDRYLKSVNVEYLHVFW